MRNSHERPERRLMSVLWAMASRKLSSVNLNQLVALDALLAEGSVTRAAQQIGVSQSALSHTLSGLRDLFGDPLLTRGREGMVLSARAEQLSGPLRRALMDLELLLERDPSFDPLTTQREFRLATVDFIAARVATQLLPAFAKLAPQARLTVRPLSFPSLIESLECGDLDAVIGPRFAPGASVEQEAWREEDFVCVVRADHPGIGTELDLKTYVALDHLLISPTGSGTGWVDQALAERDLARRVIFRAPSFLMAPIIVANSDLVLTAPHSAVELFVQALDLRRLTPPIELAPLSLVLSWHRRSTDDAGQKWFRDLLTAAA